MLGWLKSLLAAMSVFLILMLAYLMAPSSLFLKPVSWEYNKETKQATFKRLVVGNKPIFVRWSHTFYTNKGTCSTASGQRRMLSKETEDLFYLDEKLQKCLADPTAISYMTWSVLWAGILPLRPVTMVIPPDATLPE